MRWTFALLLAVVVVACTPAAPATPTRSATPLPATATVPLTDTTVPPSSTPPPSATATTQPTFTPVPEVVVVTHTGPPGLNLRKEPVSGSVLKSWPDGTTMVVVGTDRLVSGKTWRNVEDPDGNIGWAVGDFLMAIIATPLPSPSPTNPPPSPSAPPAVPSSTLPPPTATPILPTSTPVPATNTPVPAPPTVNALCVASVSAAVKYPQLGSGTQTLYVVATNASGDAVPGATGNAFVQDSTTSRVLDLPATASDGSTATAWSVGGPHGIVTITVTETGGGCTAKTFTSFQEP
jgi:hypothetical protein